MAHIAARTPPYTPPPFPLSQCHRSTHYHLRSPEDSGESELEDKKDTDSLNKDIMESTEIDEDAYIHPQAQSALLSLCPEVRFLVLLSALLFLIRWSACSNINWRMYLSYDADTSALDNSWFRGYCQVLAVETSSAWPVWQLHAASCELIFTK